MSDERDEKLPAEGSSTGELEELPEEPPVVARLVVEIRSDGSRTVARGALEDVASQQKVALEARGSSPAQLALELTRALMTLPVARLRSRRPKRKGLARRAMSALLSKRD